MSSQLGVRLRAERKARRLRQEDAGDLFGVSQSGYHRWETGENLPEEHRFGAIAEFLGITISEVWRLAHGDSYAPTSLEFLQQRVRKLEVIVGSFVEAVGELAAATTTAGAFDRATTRPLTGERVSLGNHPQRPAEKNEP